MAEKYKLPRVEQDATRAASHRDMWRTDAVISRARALYLLAICTISNPSPPTIAVSASKDVNICNCSAPICCIVPKQYR